MPENNPPPVALLPPAATESDTDFLARLERLGRDYRYSDEFIGAIVRQRFPREWPRPRPFHEYLDDEDYAVMEMEEREDACPSRCRGVVVTGRPRLLDLFEMRVGGLTAGERETCEAGPKGRAPASYLGGNQCPSPAVSAAKGPA